MNTSQPPADEMPDAPGEKRSGTIQSVSIAARFLKTLANAEGELALGEVARRTGTGGSTAHRYLQSLVKEGLARQEPLSGLYDLGPAALSIGIGALKRIDAVDIAARHMKALAQRHAASGGVAIWTERGPTLVRWYRSAYFSINPLALGDILPIDNTACGLVFQAFLPKAVVDAARERNIPIRIGVNAGSLEKDLQKKYGEPTPEALLESAMRHVDHLDKLDFQNFKVSVKASDVFMAVAAYRLLARQIEQPLHLGITEAGGLRSGTVKSAVGLGMLLAEGIGDTIRISLAADPVEEIKVGFDILKSLHLRSRGINFIACPSCSRQNFDVVKTMNELEGRLEDLLVPMDVAVIGCVVNGPGEAKEAHVGLTGGTPNLVYIDGKPSQKLTNDNLVDELERLIRQKAAEKAEADASLIARG